MRVVQIDQPAAASSESQVMDKLHAFFVTLEYLNICEFSLADLEEWRHESRGLALLLTVDTLIRKKVHRVSSDQRKKFTAFSAALVEVLTNHKQLWNDARSSAELDKFKQALQIAPATPVTKKRQRSASGSPAKKSPKALKNQARRARQKEQLKEAKKLMASQGGKTSSPKKVTRDERVPAREWQSITSFKYQGPRHCPFYNCSLGCRFEVTSPRTSTFVWSAAKSTPGVATAELTSSSAAPLEQPPGSWEASAQRLDDDQRSCVSDRNRSLGCQSKWPEWDSVLFNLPDTLKQAPFFLELFAGTAGLTEAVFLQGVPVLPPVDITSSKLVTHPQDVVDLDFWIILMDIIALGVVFFFTVAHRVTRSLIQLGRMMWWPATIALISSAHGVGLFGCG